MTYTVSSGTLNLTQPNPPKNEGQKDYTLFGFSTTSRNNGKRLLNETCRRQSGNNDLPSRRTLLLSVVVGLVLVLVLLLSSFSSSKERCTDETKCLLIFFQDRKGLKV